MSLFLDLKVAMSILLFYPVVSSISRLLKEKTLFFFFSKTFQGLFKPWNEDTSQLTGGRRCSYCLNMTEESKPGPISDLLYKKRHPELLGQAAPKQKSVTFTPDLECMVGRTQKHTMFSYRSLTSSYKMFKKDWTYLNWIGQLPWGMHTPQNLTQASQGWTTSP